jgi:hypothetical protein
MSFAATPGSIVAPWSAPNPSPPGEEMKKRYEEGPTDDRPQDRKRIAAHAEDEWLCEVELPRDPRPEQSADEPDRGGNDESAARAAAKSPADGAADRSDDNQYDEPWQCERHSDLLGTSRFEQNIGVRSRRLRTPLSNVATKTPTFFVGVSGDQCWTINYFAAMIEACRLLGVATGGSNG